MLPLHKLANNTTRQVHRLHKKKKEQEHRKKLFESTRKTTSDMPSTEDRIMIGGFLLLALLVISKILKFNYSMFVNANRGFSVGGRQYVSLFKGNRNNNGYNTRAQIPAQMSDTDYYPNSNAVPRNVRPVGRGTFSRQLPNGRFPGRATFNQDIVRTMNRPIQYSNLGPDLDDRDTPQLYCPCP